ncbi:hypothetical protein N790_05090 [Arenimonas malthae CC-JY-1]|uniref:Uncharacterized protein n=1 Tax=Arenimonas malthae CC-JY-1 TaxID=1384054 RepID=A0A091BCX5_9GAMM|nr:DUF6491 family protein [Arenimonas malthae]KFN50503.1 hypothetical protein N790_05090 [Arenimonas malthae CC-JY-1]
MNARLALTSLAFALSLGLALPALAVEPPTEPATRAAPASKAEKRLELLRANAGESVERVRFLRPMHGYEVVGPLELLVWETPFKAWLVTVRDSPACNRLEREWKLGFDVLNDTLNTANGYVVGDNGLRCRIDDLREVDVKAWRQAERDAGIAE